MDEPFIVLLCVAATLFFVWLVRFMTTRSSTPQAPSAELTLTRSELRELVGHAVTQATQPLQQRLHALEQAVSETERLSSTPRLDAPPPRRVERA